jgi:hypothetical protein
MYSVVAVLVALLIFNKKTTLLQPIKMQFAANISYFVISFYVQQYNSKNTCNTEYCIVLLGLGLCFGLGTVGRVFIYLNST